MILSSVLQRKDSLGVHTCMEFHFLLRSTALLYTVLEAQSWDIKILLVKIRYVIPPSKAAVEYLLMCVLYVESGRHYNWHRSHLLVGTVLFWMNLNRHSTGHDIQQGP